MKYFQSEELFKKIDKDQNGEITLADLYNVDLNLLQPFFDQLNEEKDDKDEKDEKEEGEGEEEEEEDKEQNYKDEL